MSEELDLAKIEAIRQRMLLSVVTIATLAGVHRVTYYSWLRGDRKPRPPQAEKLKIALGKMAKVIRDFGWPNDTVQQMGERERQQRFLDLASRY